MQIDILFASSIFLNIIVLRTYLKLSYIFHVFYSDALAKHVGNKIKQAIESAKWNLTDFSTFRRLFSFQGCSANSLTWVGITLEKITSIGDEPLRNELEINCDFKLWHILY